MHNMALGRYRLLEQLGAGGMADVWLATDQISGARVAVKRLHPHLAANPAMVERFAREAGAAAAVHHPNVVRALDAGPNDIVLEYVAGESLADRLRRGPLEAASVERVGADLGSALAAVHAAGFVHGDVTPGNVILDEDGVAHLTDFGIARPATPGDAGAPVGELMGTRPFVAPEVMAGARATPASDVWSLGATLREALTGNAPSRAGSAAERTEGPGRTAAAIGLGTLAPLLPQMLDPEPSRRPSAAAVSRILAPSPEAVTEVLTVVPPLGGGQRSGDAVGVALLPPVMSPPRRAFAPGRKVGVAVAGFLMATGLALATATPAEPAAGSQALVRGMPSPSPASPKPAATARPAASQGQAHGGGRGREASHHGHGSGGDHGHGGQEGD